MKKEEIEKKLAAVKSQEFMLQMADHWSHDDYILSRTLNDEIKELQGMLDSGEYDE